MLCGEIQGVYNMLCERLSVGLVFLVLGLSIVRCEGGGSTVPLAAPNEVTVTAGDGQITITWNAVSGATRYHIYWKIGPGVTRQNSTKISDITVTSFVHGGLTNGTQYCYAVVTANARTESNLSEEVCGTPTATMRALSVTVTGQGIVTSDPAGINCPDDCTESYISGTVVNLSTMPANGWRFDNWGGGLLRPQPDNPDNNGWGQNLHRQIHPALHPDCGEERERDGVER